MALPARMKPRGEKHAHKRAEALFAGQQQRCVINRADGVPLSFSCTHLPLPRFLGFEAVFAKKGSLTRAYKNTAHGRSYSRPCKR